MEATNKDMSSSVKIGKIFKEVQRFINDIEYLSSPAEMPRRSIKNQ